LENACHRCIFIL